MKKDWLDVVHTTLVLCAFLLLHMMIQGCEDVTQMPYNDIKFREHVVKELSEIKEAVRLRNEHMRRGSQ